MIVLTLPYPVSANRYWRAVSMPGRNMMVPTKEAKEFKEQVGWAARAAGIRTPLAGRVEIAVQLFPRRPQDWAARQRKLGATWDDTVMCLDLDNANKVLLDSLKGVVIDDDKWVRKLTAERMEPDADGARVVLYVRQLAPAAPVVQPAQVDLLGEAA